MTRRVTQAGAGAAVGGEGGDGATMAVQVTLAPEAIEPQDGRRVEVVERAVESRLREKRVRERASVGCAVSGWGGADVGSGWALRAGHRQTACIGVLYAWSNARAMFLFGHAPERGR
eukprot:1874993-Rhodomonas_salina.1